MTEITAITVVDRSNGELLDVRGAATERLARFYTDITDLKSDLDAALAVVNGELVERMDRSASWTLRVGDVADGCQWEVKAPSPTAGTETYPPEALETALRSLVEAGTVAEEAAAKALVRSVVVEFEAPLAADLEKLADAIAKAVEVQVDDTQLTVRSAVPSRKSVMNGIKALWKVPGAGEALQRVRLTNPPGPRRATVKVKR